MMLREALPLGHELNPGAALAISQNEGSASIVDDRRQRWEPEAAGADGTGRQRTRPIPYLSASCPASRR